MKKINRFIIFALLLSIFILCLISSNFNKETDLIDDSLCESFNKIDEYIDVGFFSNLSLYDKESLKTSSINSNDIECIQKTKLEESIKDIYLKLTIEEINILKELSYEDYEIKNMLDLIDSNFDESKFDLTSPASSSEIVLNSLLLSSGLTKTVVIVMQGAYKTLTTTVKAFFIPNVLKIAIISASILTLTSIIIINWNKIKPIFNNIVNIFLNSAKKLKSSVSKVFNGIYNMALNNTYYKTFDDVLNKNDEFNKKLKNSGKNINDINSLLKEFLNIGNLTTFYNSNNKVLCIGRDIKFSYGNYDYVYGYQNYAKKYNFWAFWNNNYDGFVNIFGQSFIDLCNETLVYYCVYNDYDFILVTNPYYYMKEHLDLSHGGSAYSKEIDIIRKNSYNNFINTSFNWNTIPNPRNDYYAYTGYRVSK